MHYDGNYRDTTKTRIQRFLEPPSRVFSRALTPVFRRMNSGCRILFYHEMKEDLFREHVEYLTENYNIISLVELVDSMEHDGDVPDNSVVVVFDDGRKTIYSELYPVLEEYEIPITVYLVTGAIEEGVYIWDKVNALQQASDTMIQVQELSQMSKAERQEVLSEQLDKHDITFERTALNWSEIRELREIGVDFQCHTQTHPSLPALPSEEVHKEIYESKDTIEQKLGTDVSHFSYPFGHCSESVARALQDQGFRSAVGTVAGVNTGDEDLFRLPRIGVESASIPLLASLIEGVWHTATPGKEFHK